MLSTRLTLIRKRKLSGSPNCRDGLVGYNAAFTQLRLWVLIPIPCTFHQWFSGHYSNVGIVGPHVWFSAGASRICFGGAHYYTTVFKSIVFLPSRVITLLRQVITCSFFLYQKLRWWLEKVAIKRLSGNVKLAPTKHGGQQPPGITMVPPPKRWGIQQSANMLRSRSTLLELKKGKTHQSCLPTTFVYSYAIPKICSMCLQPLKFCCSNTPLFQLLISP